MTLGYLPARGFSIFLLLTLMHAAALAPIGMLAAGRAVGALGLDVIVLLQAALLGAAAFWALRVPEIPQALYGTLGITLTAVLTVFSGMLYGRLGRRASWSWRRLARWRCL